MVPHFPICNLQCGFFLLVCFWVCMCVIWQWSTNSRKSVRAGFYAQEVNWIGREIHSTISTGIFYLKCRSKYKGSSDKKIYIYILALQLFYSRLKLFKFSVVWGDIEEGYFKGDNPKVPKERVLVRVTWVQLLGRYWSSVQGSSVSTIHNLGKNDKQNQYNIVK